MYSNHQSSLILDSVKKPRVMKAFPLLIMVNDAPYCKDKYENLSRLRRLEYGRLKWILVVE